MPSDNFSERRRGLKKLLRRSIQRWRELISLMLNIVSPENTLDLRYIYKGWRPQKGTVVTCVAPTTPNKTCVKNFCKLTMALAPFRFRSRSRWISFSIFSRMANLQALWHISVRSAPLKPLVTLAIRVKSTSCWSKWVSSTTRKRLNNAHNNGQSKAHFFWNVVSAFAEQPFDTKAFNFSLSVLNSLLQIL